jgi:hypothetical protein
MRPQYFARLLIAVVALAACADQSATPTAVLPADAAANSAGALVGFGFNGPASGFPTGAVILTGGGSFNPATANNIVPNDTRVAAGGGFSCTDPVNQGPLANCAAGEGVRWDTVQLLASTSFKCTGADVAKVATTGDRTAVLLADFYRAGDGNEDSFTAQIIVSDEDLADNIPGLQNLWVQGVGCGTAIVNFSK